MHSKFYANEHEIQQGQIQFFFENTNVEVNSCEGIQDVHGQLTFVLYTSNPLTLPEHHQCPYYFQL